MLSTISIIANVKIVFASDITKKVSIESTGTITYPGPGQILFSGYIWDVRNSDLSGPGPNYWSNNTENVWLDENGYLHLKITYTDGKWVCPEVRTQTLGYGTYTFYTASNIDALDKNVVLGLFAYKDDSHEVDIEFSRWGIENYTNAGFTFNLRLTLQIITKNCSTLT